MRNLLLLMVLLNALVFAYQHWIIEPNEPVAATHREQAYPGLLLAAAPQPEPPEVVGPAGSAESADVEADADIAADNVCTRVGPFAAAADAQAVERTVRERGATVRQTLEQGRVWVGHWVQVTGLESRPQGETMLARLAAAGMADAYIFSTEGTLRISLGVFRARSSADRALQQARSLGFSAMVEDRYQPGTQIWLWLQLPGDSSLRPGELKSVSGQIIRAETVSCADAGF